MCVNTQKMHFGELNCIKPLSAGNIFQKYLQGSQVLRGNPAEEIDASREEEGARRRPPPGALRAPTSPLPGEDKAVYSSSVRSALQLIDLDMHSMKYKNTETSGDAAKTPEGSKKKLRRFWCNGPSGLHSL